MNITIVNQQGHNFGDEAAGAGLLNRILQYEEVENVTVLYASDSILPITDSRIIHKPDISLKNVGLKNLITYYLFGSKIVKNKKLNEWIRIIKTLHMRNKERVQQGKKITYVDDRYLKEAKENLYE